MSVSDESASIVENESEFSFGSDEFSVGSDESDLNFGDWEIENPTIHHERNDSLISSSTELKSQASQEDETCFFKRPCLKDLQDALVDSTKDNSSFYAILASITAAVGLATNSPTAVIGSMLLSPIGDLIVRLSLVSNFWIHKKRGNTDHQNFSRKAFQERFLERLGIPTHKFVIRNVGKGDKSRMILWLKAKSSEDEDDVFKDEILQIFKYHDVLYFNLNDGDNNQIFSLNGTLKFLRSDEGNMYIIKDGNDKTDKFIDVDKFNIIEMKEIRKKIIDYEEQSWTPGKNPKKYYVYSILWTSFWVCAICIFIGFICGYVFYSLRDNTDFKIPTKEMIDRTKIENAYGMIFIAAAAGLVLPYAVRRKNAIRLVGINIATALLPPLVNIGLYLGIILKKREEGTFTKGTEEYNSLMEAIGTGFLIFGINFILLLGISIGSLYIFCKGEREGIFKDFDLC